VGILVDRNTPPVAVRFGNEPDDGLEVNIVYIKAKLSLGDTVRIEEASYKMEFARPEDGDGKEEMAQQPYRVPLSSIGQMIAALRHAVTGWEGPMFEGVRYRRSVWDDLDISQCEWWIALVHGRLNELNKPTTKDPVKAKSPNAKAP
jgi:hypothetical protein